MKNKFASGSPTKGTSIGGVEAAAKIMNLVKADMANTILAKISVQDEDLATEIQDNMFKFDTLVAMDNRAIQAILRKVSQDQLAKALKGVDDKTQQKFLINMSRRAKQRLLDDMHDLTSIKATDIEMAQKNITRTARKLADAGDIVLAIRRDEFV